MTDLTAVPAQWVTLRALTEEGRPIVVLVDQALATTAPYADRPLQVAIAVPLGATEDGLPAPADVPALQELEQHLVDAAAAEGRLVAVMTLEGVREWMFYARSSDWADDVRGRGLSVVVHEDPTWHGLQELAGLT